LEAVGIVVDMRDIRLDLVGWDGMGWDGMGLYGDTYFTSLVIQVRGLFPLPSSLLFHTKRKTTHESESWSAYLRSHVIVTSVEDCGLWIGR
jgi:hypothetical protein